jgi:hypothetical protein
MSPFVLTRALDTLSQWKGNGVVGHKKTNPKVGLFN